MRLLFLLRKIIARSHMIRVAFFLSLLFSHFSFVFHVESLILQCTDQMKEKESESKRLN